MSYGDPTSRAWEITDAEDTLTDGVPTRRVLAWLVDIALIGVISTALFVALLLFGLLTLGLAMPLLAIVPLVAPLYNFLFLLAPPTATPGQMLLGLTVRRDDDLGPPTALQALLTTLGFYLTMATGVIWLAVALISARRRTLHDMVSGLVVVRTGALTPAARSWNMRFE